jgi:hypothetical protein
LIFVKASFPVRTNSSGSLNPFKMFLGIGPNRLVVPTLSLSLASTTWIRWIK